jgi:leukotriene-A4 hydrolase
LRFGKALCGGTVISTEGSPMIRSFPAAMVSALALSVALGACATMPGNEASVIDRPAMAASAPVDYVRDIHSHARPEVARVVHVDLDLTADFERRVLTGTALLEVTAEAGASEIILDVRDLDIRAVRSNAGPLTYRLSDPDPILGQAMTVALPSIQPGQRASIMIDYSTHPEAEALQWLTPEQTAGGRLPYVFSQGQAILTRTWIPTQDSPGIRQSYNARIVVPEAMTAVMSAEMLTPEGEVVAGQPGMRAFRFELDNPVPPYLIALGIGDIAFAPLGERTGVYTEPSELAAAHAEFPEVERMVRVAEDLYGPYRWGRYDLLVLPPSFPFGGMENPRLTFATPTIIAGDRSLVALVAHELAHSWSGNLVTNATWADFWLNEGFTVYFENRIMEAVYGRERALMEQSLGWQDLQETIADLPPAETALYLDMLEGRSPDDGMTDIAYEKGALFLRTIERTVGRERFDAWLSGYFDRNAYRPMTTARFLEDIRSHLVTTPALEEALMMDAWIYQPGLPSNAQAPTSDAFVLVDAQLLAFAGGAPAAALETDGWITQQWQHFLNGLPQGLTAAQMADLDATFSLSSAGNAEVRFAWLMNVVKNRYEPGVASLRDFLTSMGRRKFTQPLYVALMAHGDWGQPIARRIYDEARPGYHPITTGSADPVVLGR